MKFIVLGAGAVGGYFGGRLAHAGVDVSFFVREKRAQLLRSNGLCVHSVHGDFSIEPSVITTPSEVDKPDVVIVALKNYHLDAALPSLSAFVQKGAVLLPILNGIKHVDTFIDMFGQSHVLGGTCTIESTLNQDGEIEHTSQMHDMVFGAFGEIDSSWLEELENELKKGGFPIRQSNRIRYDMWQKFLFLTSLSSITAGTRQPIGAALSNPFTREFLKGLISEGCRVARAVGIELPDTQESKMIQAMERLSPAMTSSLHRDMIKQLPIELDRLQGAMIEIAKSKNIDTPCFTSIYQLLNPYKDGGLAPLSLT